MRCPRCGFQVDGRIHNDAEIAQTHPDACAAHCFCERFEFEHHKPFVKCCKCKVTVPMDPGEPYFSEP